MVASQKQSADDGATAIQAGRDVNVNNGLTTTQMVEIISALSTHVDTLAGIAKSDIETRLSKFEANLMERFATDETARSEAFREPDFLAATLDAQKAYARSGDDELGSVLVDLIAQRSKCTERTRLSLTLNDAIAKAGSIPSPDLNALSLIFLLKNVTHNGLNSLQSLAGFLNSAAVPLLSNISSSESAMSYLAAHGCILPPSSVGEHKTAVQLLSVWYGPIVTKGVTEKILRDNFPEYDVLAAMGLIVDSPYGGGLKTFSVVGQQARFFMARAGIYGNYLETYAELTKDAAPSDDEFTSVMSTYIPEIKQLVSTYDIPVLRNSRLTSVGIALAHANLASGPFRDVDLSIWITP